MKYQKQISKLGKYVKAISESISSHAVFKNKYFFYLAATLAFLRLIDYLIHFQIVHIFYYLLTALTVYFFTDNLTIVCLITFLTTTLCLGNTKEGLENKEDTSSDTVTTPKTKPTLMKPLDEEEEGDVKTLPVAESLQNKSTDTKKKNTRLDYASTIEDSYKMLDKMLSKEGIQNLNTDTQSLIKQQAKLGKMMESMSPLMKSAQDLLKQFNPKSGK
jgi:hypothetical protein